MTSPNRPQPPKRAGVPMPSFATTKRKGKLSGGIIAISSAAIVAVYALGRANTSAVTDQFSGNASAAVGSVVPGTQTAGAVRTSSVAYKDGTYTGSGNSRHGGMVVKVVVKDGKITSANVDDCSTRYPCSDVDSLVRSAVTRQSVPANHVSGATDSSQAYKQALTNALKQAKA